MNLYRMMGSLLSAHLIVSDETRLLGDFFMPEYDGELLDMARDLAVRLMPAFEGTSTGMPYFSPFHSCACTFAV